MKWKITTFPSIEVLFWDLDHSEFPVGLLHRSQRKSKSRSRVVSSQFGGIFDYFSDLSAGLARDLLTITHYTIWSVFSVKIISDKTPSKPVIFTRFFDEDWAILRLWASRGCRSWYNRACSWHDRARNQVEFHGTFSGFSQSLLKQLPQSQNLGQSIYVFNLHSRTQKHTK